MIPTLAYGSCVARDTAISLVETGYRKRFGILCLKTNNQTYIDSSVDGNTVSFLPNTTAPIIALKNKTLAISNGKT